MAYWPDTGTGVDTQPARKPVQSALRKYFTEGGIGQPPTVPGGDWFNQMTNEVLNVLEAAGIEPSKTDDDQLLQAILRVSKDMSASEALRRSYAEAGYSLRPRPESFEAGGILVNANDVLLQESTGKAFSGPVGTVAAETNPTSGGFVDVSGELFRQQVSRRNFTDDARNYGFDADAPDNTAAMQSFISSGNKNLVIYESYRLAQSIAIPNNKNLYFFRNSSLIVTNGTLTVNCKIIADATPVSAVFQGVALVNSFDITVGNTGDYGTINEAIAAVPATQWQRFNILVSPGTYNEDVLIANKWAASYTIGAVTGERTGVYVRGNKATTFIKSASMVGSGGASFTPSIEGFTITGANTDTNEDSAFEAYGCPSAAMLDVSFQGSAAHDKAIMSYGSVLSVENVDFKNDTYNDFFVTKHGGVIQSNGNTRLGVLSSPTGRAVRFCCNPISGRIDIMDMSGMSSQAGTKVRASGALNGITYDSNTRSVFGPAYFDGVLSTYQTYFTSIGDFTVFNNGSGANASIDATRGLKLIPGPAVGSYSSAFMRRVHTIGSQSICFNQQLLVAAEMPATLDGQLVFIGIGNGNSSVRFEISGTEVRGVFTSSAGVTTSTVVCQAADIVNDRCVFSLTVERSSYTQDTNAAVAHFKISTDSLKFYSSLLMQTGGGTNQHEWYLKAQSQDGSQQTFYFGELRLYRS